MRIVDHGLKRIGFEVRGYFRAPEQVFFTFLFPVLMYMLFGSIFSSETIPLPDGEITMAEYYLPAMVTMAVLLAGTQNLGLDIATERLEGGLKRLGATPLHPVSFFIGKFGQVFVTCLVQVVLVVITGLLLFGAELPSTASQWTTLAWLFLLGLACFSVLGIALSAVPRSSRTVAAVVIPVVLLPQFISGIFLQWSALPDWLQTVAAVLPLKWLAQGMRSVFLPDAMAAAEQTGAWELGLVAIVLGAWFVAGAVLTALTFRWTRGRG
ncbi:transport permease protein [Pseudoclavibacter endophyticus]|uniref:ABC transporter permease n=1 Tax=Pseudoclavibacter endophyticus TaxID=1778590 RepID=A0A6H9WQ13_9MICO|nr:ABC transporter permease [Pseudoclavibacter endophyticus]KAB1648095.1 ABC transporter permease [Pseudoclavibacter endophyticus]GGA69682.1 transport permease protein [Pseudoclavibacter endophyticus]